MLLKMAGIQMLFSALFQFATLFITVYYMRGGGVRDAALFNLILYLTWGAAFFAAFRFTEKGTRKGLIIAGVASMLGMLGMLLNFGGIWLASACIGISGGFFWPSFLYVYQSMGTMSEEGQLYARIGLLSSLIALFIPMIVGVIVAGAGFHVGFGVMFALSVGLALLGASVPEVKTERIRFRRATWRHTAYYSTNVARGFFTSFLTIAGGLLVYAATGNEAAMGSLSTLFGLVSLLASTVLAYWVPARYQKTSLVLSSVLYVAAAGLFSFHGLWVIIAYNILLSIANPFSNNILMGLNFAYMRRHFHNQAEAMLTREWALTIGRAAYFGGMMVFGMGVKSRWFLLELLIMSLLPLLAAIGSLHFDRDREPTPSPHTGT